MRKTLSFSLALMAAFSAASASAADVTEDLMISATVNNECSMLVTQLGGGEYNGLALARRATPTARCWCVVTRARPLASCPAMD
ncbi:hypothetical protein JY467_01595 [Stenotrophomonas maltophilia]|nr:hypothetical protein [Stenotrophomonas maltophilia]